MDLETDLEKSDVCDPLKHLFSLDLGRTSPILDEVTHNRASDSKCVKKVRFADHLISDDTNHNVPINNSHKSSDLTVADAKSILKLPKRGTYSAELQIDFDNDLNFDDQENCKSEHSEEISFYSDDSFECKISDNEEENSDNEYSSENLDENLSDNNHTEHVNDNVLKYFDNFNKGDSQKITQDKYGFNDHEIKNEKSESLLSNENVANTNACSPNLKNQIELEDGNFNEMQLLIHDNNMENEFSLINEKMSNVALEILSSESLNKNQKNLMKNKISSSYESNYRSKGELFKVTSNRNYQNVNRHLNTCLGFKNNKIYSRLKGTGNDIHIESTFNKKSELLQSKQTLKLNALLIKDSSLSAAELKSNVFSAWHSTKNKRKEKCNENIPTPPKEKNSDKMTARTSEEAYMCWKKSKKFTQKKKVPQTMERPTNPHTFHPNKKVEESENQMAFNFWKKKKDEIIQQNKHAKRKAEQEKQMKSLVDKEIKKKDAEIAYNAWKIQKKQAIELEKRKKDLFHQKEEELLKLKTKRDDDAQAIYYIWLHTKEFSNKISLSKSLENRPPWTPP